MSTKPHISIKHSIIDKANSTMLISVSIAVFIVVFSAFSIKALVSQSLYHSRVIAEQEKTLKVLNNNSSAAEQLRETYVAFATQSINVLGGNPAGNSPRDGDNAQIVLDALPSEYDFPALSSSIEKILVEGGYQIGSIGGTEDSSQIGSDEDSPGVSGGSVATTGAVSPVEIPYPFTIEASQDSVQILLETLESSIRPFYVSSLSLDGQGSNLRTKLDVKTFYQPATSLQVSTTEID
jgi:hypothetical protein